MNDSFVTHEYFEAKVESIEAKIGSIHKRFDNKVDWKHFYWILGLLITITITINGFILNEIKEVRRNVYEMNNKIGQIGSTFDQLSKYEFFNLDE